MDDLTEEEKAHFARIEAGIDEIVKDHDPIDFVLKMKPFEYYIYSILVHMEGEAITIRGLAERSSIALATTHKAIKSLLEKGLITKNFMDYNTVSYKITNTGL